MQFDERRFGDDGRYSNSLEEELTFVKNQMARMQSEILHMRSLNTGQEKEIVKLVICVVDA